MSSPASSSSAFQFPQPAAEPNSASPSTQDDTRGPHDEQGPASESASLHTQATGASQTVDPPRRRLWVPASAMDELLEWKEQLDTNAHSMRDTTNAAYTKVYRDSWAKAKTTMVTMTREASKAWGEKSTTWSLANQGTEAMMDLFRNVGELHKCRERMECASEEQGQEGYDALASFVALHDQLHWSVPADQSLESKAAATDAACAFQEEMRGNMKRRRLADADALYAENELRASNLRRDLDASRISTIFSSKALWGGLAAALSVAYLVSRAEDKRKEWAW